MRDKCTRFMWGDAGTGKESAGALDAHSLTIQLCPICKGELCGDPKFAVESELFGYEKGAFTGAHNAKPGRLSRRTRARSSSTRLRN